MRDGEVGCRVCRQDGFLLAQPVSTKRGQAQRGQKPGSGAIRIRQLRPHLSALRRCRRHTVSVGFIFDLLATMVGDALMPEWRKRKSAEFDCSLRVIDGSQEGLGDGWHCGEVSVQPGRLGFVVGYQLRDGFLEGFRKPAPPISVTVGSVATERQRKPNDREEWKVNVNSEIVELTTDTAALEWAVPTKGLKLALERLQSAGVSSG